MANHLDQSLDETARNVMRDYLETGYCDHLLELERLFKTGAKIDNYHLHYACEIDTTSPYQLSLVRHLLKLGADPNRTRASNWTPLELVVVKPVPNHGLIDLLLEHRAKYWRVHLITAIKTGHLGLVQKLVKREYVDLDYHLSVAIKNNYFDIFLFLAGLGANLDSVLGDAIFAKSSIYLKYLLQEGVDCGSYNGKLRMSPLHYYLYAFPRNTLCSLEIMYLLMSQTKDVSGCLSSAIRVQHMVAARVMLFLGADVNYAGNMTPVQAAVTGNKLDLLRTMVKMGGDLSKSFPGNETMLHVAVRGPDHKLLYHKIGPKPEMVRYLLDYCDVDGLDKDGKTAFQLACELGNVGVVECFEGLELDQLVKGYYGAHPRVVELVRGWIGNKLYYIVWCLDQQMIGATQVFPQPFQRMIIKMLA